MATYEVILHVESPHLSTLLPLFEGTEGIRLVRVMRATEAAVAPPTALPVGVAAPATSPTVPQPTPAPTPLAQPPVVATNGHRKPKPNRYVGGSRLKRITGADLLRQFLGTGPKGITEIKATFCANGFAESSAAPSLSVMMKAGEVIRALHGRYAMVEKKDENNSENA